MNARPRIVLLGAALIAIIVACAPPGDSPESVATEIDKAPTLIPVRVGVEERFAARYLHPLPEFLETVPFPDEEAVRDALETGAVDLAVVTVRGAGPHPGWPLETRLDVNGNLVSATVLTWRGGEDVAFAARVAAARLYGIVAGAPEITISAVGDVMTGRTIQDTMDVHGYEYPFEYIAPHMRRAQVGFANIEVVIADEGEPVEKVFVFRSNPAVIPYLAELGLSLAALANNHALDFGAEGMADMIEGFRRQEILTAGGGMNEAEARAPAFVTVRGIRFGFVSAVDVPIEPNGYHRPHMEAVGNSPGMFWAEPALVRDALVELEDNVDVSILALHSGYEYWNRPNDIQIAVVEAALEGGADIIIGSHPHVLQPVELEHGNMVLFSLGNGVFDIDDYDRAYPGLPSTFGAIANIHLRGAEVVAADFVPIVHHEEENRPVPADRIGTELIAANLGVSPDDLRVGRVNRFNTNTQEVQ